MYESDWTECRLANWPSGQSEAYLFSERHTPGGRQLHEQIVRMLTIGDLQIPIRFAHLKDMGVAPSLHGGRFSRHPAGKRQRATREAPRSHHHQPVLGIELCLAPSAALSIERQKNDTVESETPPAHVVQVILRGGTLA
jgi:hypothetical protein